MFTLKKRSNNNANRLVCVWCEHRKNTFKDYDKQSFVRRLCKSSEKNRIFISAKVDDRWNSSTAIKWFQRTKFTFVYMGSHSMRHHSVILLSNIDFILRFFSFRFILFWLIQIYTLNSHRFHLRFTFTETQVQTDRSVGCAIGVSEMKLICFVGFQHRSDIMSVKFHTQLLFG